MRRLSIFVALLGALSTRSLAAQAAGAQTMPIPIIGIGGGISIPAGGIAKDRQPGFNLGALAEFRTPSEPLGLRAELLYQYFGRDQNALNSTSANTVAVHRANIMDALGIHKTAELVVYAIRNGLVNIP